MQASRQCLGPADEQISAEATEGSAYNVKKRQCAPMDVAMTEMEVHCVAMGPAWQHACRHGHGKSKICWFWDVLFCFVFGGQEPPERVTFEGRGCIALDEAGARRPLACQCGNLAQSQAFDQLAKRYPDRPAVEETDAQIWRHLES